MPHLSFTLTACCLVGLLSGLSLTACGGKPAVQKVAPPAPHSETSKPPPATLPVEERPIPLAFETQGEGATEELAYQQARHLLLVALLSDDQYLTKTRLTLQLAQVVHERATDAFEKQPAAAGISVRIGISSERLSSALERLECALSEVELKQDSTQLRQAIFDLHVVQLKNTICVRRKQLLQDEDCQAPPTEPAADVVRQLVGAIQLEPLYEGGIPVHAGVALRPLQLRAYTEEFAHPKALAELPLEVIFQKEQPGLHVLTDAQGRLKQSVPEEQPQEVSLTVRVDVTTLVAGDLSKLRAPEIHIPRRTIGLQRRATIHRDNQEATAVVSIALERELARQLAGQAGDPVELSTTDRKKLQHLSPPLFKKNLPSFADRYGGKLDVVLFLHAQSEFASRMGTHRLWYEARGKLVAVNAWNGAVLAEVETATTASGVGERRAEQASREALAELLTTQLLKQLKDSMSE
jgi:hypothetical protein